MAASNLETGYTAMILKCAWLNSHQAQTCYCWVPFGMQRSQSWNSKMEIQVQTA